MAELDTKTNTKKTKPALVGLLLIVLGLVLAAVSIFMLRANNVVEPQSPSSDLTQTEAAPSSVKPKPAEVDNYKVAPTLPKYIDLPSISQTKVRVMNLGVTKDNQIAVPSNIYDAGWYNQSAKPGQAGAMFIYGHVSSWTANGVFHDLKKLKPGDSVTVVRGDNKHYTYKVDQTKIYKHDKVDMNEVLAPINPDKPGLNLMTCTGHVIKDTSEFSERLVVYTSQIN